MTNTQSNPDKENTYALNPENPSEMSRLINLDIEITRAMGGPLSGIDDPSAIKVAVDLGCGPGGWVLDAAFALPTADIAGIDISQIMTDYARARAISQRIRNASFGIMNITQPLDLSAASFDLVNARFLLAVLHRENWVPFLTECLRILRPGGLIRLTESVDGYSTNSPAYERFARWLYLALHRVGYGFSPDGSTIDLTPALPPLLRSTGYQNVRFFSHALEISAGTTGWAHAYYNTMQVVTGIKPLLIKTGVATADEIEATNQQLLIDMNQDTFAGMFHYMSFVATKPDEP